MKRSEALKKIEDVLRRYKGVSIDDCFGLTEDILFTLEEDVGMQPPYDSSSDDEDPIHAWVPE